MGCRLPLRLRESERLRLRSGALRVAPAAKPFLRKLDGLGGGGCSTSFPSCGDGLRNCVPAPLPEVRGQTERVARYRLSPELWGFCSGGEGAATHPEGSWWRGWRTDPGGSGTRAVPARLPCSPPLDGPGTDRLTNPVHLGLCNAPLGLPKAQGSFPPPRNAIPSPVSQPGLSGHPTGTHPTGSPSDTGSPEGPGKPCLLGANRAQRTQLHGAAAKGTHLATQTLILYLAATRLEEREED